MHKMAKMQRTTADIYVHKNKAISIRGGDNKAAARDNGPMSQSSLNNTNVPEESHIKY